MLIRLREAVTGWFSTLMLAMIAVPFAMWGVQNYTSDGPQGGVAAKVNDGEITQQEFQNSYQNQRARLQQALGKAFDPEKLDEPKLKRETLDALIANALIEQTARQAGFGVSDAQLAARIREIQLFHKDGVFSAEAYSQQLRQQGMTPESFEPRMRQAILTEQLQQGVTETTFVPRASLDTLFRLREQKRTLSWLVLPLAPLREAIKPDETAIKAWYEQHQAGYKAAERAQVEYLELSVPRLAAAVTVDEARLKKFYDENQASYGREEQRRASHILIALPKDADAKTDTEARKKIEDLAAQLRAGGDFAALAKANSADTVSAQQGGDLGLFGRGVMDKAFEDAAFALKQGELSAPVKSSFGYHLIQLTEIQPKAVKPFADAQGEVEADYRRHEAEQRFYDLAEQIGNASYESPDSLEPAAKLVGAPLQLSGWITRESGEGVGAHEGVRRAAFADDVLSQGNNSEVIEVTPSHVVVLRMKAHEAERAKPLAEVREQVITELREARAREQLKAEGDTLSQRLVQDKAALTVVAGERKLEVKHATVSRSDASLPPELVKAAFTAGPKAPAAAGLALDNGDYALLVLDKIEDGQVTAADALLAYAREVARLYGTVEYDLVADALRERADVKVNTEKLD
jgi:peptidyl-prolyl cis-trans isomerase D